MSNRHFAPCAPRASGALVLTFSTLCLLLMAPFAVAQPATWTGASNTFWNMDTNWNPTGIPNATGRNVTFNAAASGFVVNISNSVTAGSLTFDNLGQGKSYSLTSNPNQTLTLAGSTDITVTDSVAAPQTINLANVAAGSLLFTGTTSSALTVFNQAPGSLTAQLVIGPNTRIVATEAGGGVLFTGTGHTLVSGSIVTSPGGLTKEGNGTLTLSGTNTFSGATRLGGGKLSLDYSAAASSKLPSGALVSTGGALSLQANAITAYAEVVTSTTLNGGHTDFSGQGTFGSPGTISLNLQAITRTPTATANFFRGTGSSFLTSNTNTNGILSGALTMGLGDWATASDGEMVPLATYSSAFTAGANVDVAADASVLTASINSLRIRESDVTLSIGNTLTVQSGGIIQSASGDRATIKGGNELIVPAGVPMYVHTFGESDNPLTIATRINAPDGLVKSGSGTLILSGSNTTLTGPIDINRGNLTITNTSAISSASTIRFNDARGDRNQVFTVETDNDSNGTISRSIQLGLESTEFATRFSTGANLNSRITLSGVISSAAGKVTPLTIGNFFNPTGPNNGFNLTGSNTFTGPIKLEDGFLGIDADSSLGNPANPLILSVGSATAGGLEFLNGGINVSRPVQVSFATRIVSNGVDVNTISGVMSDGPVFGGFVKAGTGTLVLTGANTYSSSTRIDAGALRIAADANLGAPAAELFISGGTLETTATFSVSAARQILLGLPSGGPGAGTIDVAAATALTVPGTVSNSSGAVGALEKTGAGTLVLTGSNTYSGGTTVRQGELRVNADAALGNAAGRVAIEPLGSLTFIGSTSTGRTYNLTSSSLSVAAGQILTLNGATIGGGFLGGPGTFTLMGGTSLKGSNTDSGTVINQNGAATVSNFTNNGQFTNQSGQTLTWSKSTNTSAGRLTINGTANVSEFVSDGAMTINPGGIVNNSVASMVLGGGSTTTLGSSATPGGTIALGGQSLDLRGGLLANFGVISGGTINVYYGGLAAGTGTFPVVVLHPGGAYTPGVTLATVPVPAPTSSAAILPLDPNQISAASLMLNANTLATVSSANGTLTFANPLEGPGKTLTKVGGGALALSRLRTGALALSEGTVKLRPGLASRGTSTLSGLTIGSAARLNMTDNRLIVSGGDIAAITALAKSGYHGGAWDGPGIMTSAVTSSTGLGVARADDIAYVGKPFGDVTAAAGDVLVMYTLAADANLDARVDFNDLVRLAQNYNTTGKLWHQGNSNYDDIVDFNDLVNLAQNYNSALAGSVPGASAEFERDVARAFAEVPEPGIGALGAWALLLMMRRPSRPVVEDALRLKNRV